MVEEADKKKDLGDRALIYPESCRRKKQKIYVMCTCCLGRQEMNG